MSLSLHSFSLMADERSIEKCRELLSDDELKRADRFRFEKHRRRFTIARSNLRITLTEYTGIEPADIRFKTTIYGKPFIHPKQNPAAVSFNLSHSHELALVAICRENAIGVDVEYVKKDRPFMALAQRYFLKNEIEYLIDLPETEQQKAFYRIWTLKEAWMKATGIGIMGLGLVGTAISMQGKLEIVQWGENSRQIGGVGKPADNRHFEPESGYIAAYTRLYSSQIVSTR
ncbi:4'-phosphopantetheinyl transferase superfamily protein [bacterium]|nr:4'-phosphopantetheinyl transferase superfamily protein [bacterium]